MTEAPGYYAVIFSSVLSGEDTGEYQAMAQRLLELAEQQPGFLGMESVREADGRGITVSYWRDRAAIQAWKKQAEHAAAQRLGRERWYREFTLRICRVERERRFP